MTTVVKLGPADHGRPMTLEEFLAGEFASGYKYELIDGKLYVSPAANYQSAWVQRWLFLRLELYRVAHPEVINLVTFGARVFVPDRPGETAPEPDVAVYQGPALEQSVADIRWQDISPIVVAEVVSSDPEKDLTRNVQLYRQVPAIREYWILDPRASVEQPSMHIYRRQGTRWRRFDVPAGGEYSTRLLPGLTLQLNTRS
jgi:Uma2 family endonuclease